MKSVELATNTEQVYLCAAQLRLQLAAHNSLLLLKIALQQKQTIAVH